MATIIPKKHQEFIRLVAQGMPQNEAYKATSNNPKATAKTAKEQGSKIAKRYALEIQQAKERAAKIVEEANNSEVAQNALKSVLTQAEVDAELSKIIKGELIEVQQLNSQGKVFKAKITPTIAERRAAIETYNKRFGSNLAIKVDHTTKGESLVPIDVSKLSTLEIESILKKAKGED